jgi:lysophospholipase L1-like esterase
MKFVYRVASYIFVVFTINAALSEQNANGSVQIIGFGDSITAGRPYSELVGGGRPNYGGYEPPLVQLFTDDGFEADVYNWGVGGETTPEGVNRIDSVLSTQASDYVLIMEGTNDQWEGISEITTATNLEVMIDKCRAAGTIPILGNLTPADRDTGNQIPNVYNPAIAKMVTDKEISEKTDVELVDHYSAVIDRWGELHADPVHPNLEGYQAIAQTWFNSLKPIIRSRFNRSAIILLLLD